MLNRYGEHVTRDGKIIPLKDITNSHLINIIKYIEKRSRDGFYVALTCCWNPADPDSMFYEEDYVNGDEALSILNYDAYVNELNRRKANGVNHEKA